MSTPSKKSPMDVLAFKRNEHCSWPKLVVEAETKLNQTVLLLAILLPPSAAWPINLKSEIYLLQNVHSLFETFGNNLKIIKY